MGPEPRARLALLGLLSVTLFGFLDVFADGSFVGPALLGIALALGVSVGGRRLGLPSSLTLLAGLVVAFVYLGLIFQPSLTLLGLPTPAAARAMADAIRSAYSHSQVDFAPVPVRSGYAIMLAAGFWIAAALGEVATFRWRRPLIAAGPAVTLFAVGLIVGSGKTTAFWVPVFLVALMTFLATEATYSMRFWGRWVTAWSERGDDEPDDTSGPIARRMAAVCLAGALVAPAVMPGLDSGVLSWRNDAGQGPGGGGAGATGPGSDSGRLDPLVSIVPHLIHQTSSVLFSVRTDQPEYLRLITLTRFDGTNWTPPDQSQATIAPDGTVPPSPGLPDRPRVVRESITVDNLSGVSVPAVEGARRATVGAGAAGRTLLATSETGDLRITGELDNGVNYETSSAVPDIGSFKELETAPIGHVTDPDLYRLPRALSVAVAALRDRWIGEASTPMQKLVQIQAHLRNFTYQITAHTQPTQDYLSQFLLITRLGYCQQFATAFALLARSLHYPTRVVVGFLPGRKTADGVYQVRGTDAHAWPEVYFGHFGWVRFEPTPRANSDAATAPAYTGPAGQGAAGSAAAPGALGGNANNKNPRQISGRENFRSKSGGLRSAAADASTWYAAFKRLLGVLTLLGLAFLLAVPALTWGRIRRRYASADDDSATARAAFAQFEDRTISIAMPRRASESATAFAARVASARSLPLGVARRLASIYEAAEYSTSGITRGAASEARSLAGRLDAALWLDASLLDRALLLFSPRAVVRNGRNTGPKAARA